MRGFNRPLKHNGIAHLTKNNQLCLLGILETKLATPAIGAFAVFSSILPMVVVRMYGIPLSSTFTRRASLHKAKETDLALQDAQLQLESDPENTAIQDSLGELRKNVVFLAEVEKHFYYQKAKIHFLKMGDQNTKSFHDMVKRNAAKSSILTITKSNGSTIISAADIDQEFITYFTSLLGAELQTLPVDNDVFEWGPKLSIELALELCRAVTPLELNHSIIALVPKSEHSPTVANYWLISCCNVIYKAITKIIVDRLTPALEHLIDCCQAAFVGGRSITDNIFLAQEMVRQYTRK
ncbi:UNVERIFIED_CONTAM: hypothetical protein Slati_4293400 [Sesamum latifolium]|uniref:Reverse transcriptase domain-containing protein n=1 Tax=Sesamum latifolium TaxID=2727402 RepID=A0AAW2TD06_9LAMI